MPAPTIVYFGQHPSTIIMQSSTNFNGSAQTGTPTLSPALYVFPAQAGGGLYNFHDLVGCQESITILSISYKGGGSLQVNKVFNTVSGTPSLLVGTITSAGDLTFEEGDLTLAPGVDLTFVSSGGTTPIVAVTAMLTSGCWSS